jgi:hypothetical protein
LKIAQIGPIFEWHFKMGAFENRTQIEHPNTGLSGIWMLTALMFQFCYHSF